MLYSAIRFLPRPLLELAAFATRDEHRRLVCLEMIRLRHKDAASLPSYLDRPTNTTSGTAGQLPESGKASLKPHRKVARR